MLAGKGVRWRGGWREQGGGQVRAGLRGAAARGRAGKWGSVGAATLPCPADPRAFSVLLPISDERTLLLLRWRDGIGSGRATQ